MGDFIEAQQRRILHSTVTGSLAAGGSYTFSITELEKYAEVRVLTSATSSALTVGFQQQISSHGTIYDQESLGLAVASGGTFDFQAAGTRGTFTISAVSATQHRTAVYGIPIGD